MYLLLFYLFLALGVSFLCSLTEASILSIPPTRVSLLLREGRASGRLLDEMKRNIDRPLAAILTLNTIAHTVGAAGVGAQALFLFGQKWVAVVSAVLTLLILVLSEIIPKTLGAVYSVGLSGFTAYVIKGMIILTFPLVVCFQALSRLIGGGRAAPEVTRDEIAMIAELGEEAGALAEQEAKVISNLLHLHRIPVEKIMTPRSVTFMLQKDLTVEQAISNMEGLRFSRIPVFGETPDDVTGKVLRHRIYEAYRDGRKEQTIETMAESIHPIPENASVRQALNVFMERSEQIFLAVDEYGGNAGVVTLEDAIETLLGEEIVDETDRVADMRELAGMLYRRKFYGRGY
jgi:CBS domain containing-hemolysin-like protein